MPRISVIVPARDAERTLPELLSALRAQERPPDEVIVVDDGSRDGTAALAGAAPGVEVLRTRGAGPGAARNAGAAAAQGELLAFTDADCAPEPGWLAGLERAAAGGAALVQGAVAPARPPGPWERTISVERPHGLWETANLALTRAAWEELGGFRPGLAPGGGKELGEDVELGWRARRAGLPTAWAPDARVRHAVLRRGPAGFVAERARLAAFPVLAARVPELRSAFLHRRVFLSPHTAAFDLALAGAVLALASRRPAPALLALPYARRVRRRPGRSAFHLAADAVGAAALLRGSLQARRPVL